ncbi:MAG: helix-turn-helix domain-containing protein [Methylohalobius sp.]|nr:helix-turn-helix domain-containing protein [Methylohalobius sp.]
MRRLEIPDQALLLASLRQAARQSPQAAFLHRLHCLHLLSLGFSCYQVAQWFGKDPKTLERWVHRYLKLGEKGLRPQEKPGRKSLLDAAQLGILKLDLDRSPRAFGYQEERWSGRLLVRHIEKRFKVALSLRQCQRLLRRFRHDAAELWRSLEGRKARLQVKPKICKKN